MLFTETLYLEIKDKDYTIDVEFFVECEEDPYTGKITYDIDLHKVIGIVEDDTGEIIEIPDIYEILSDWLDKDKNYNKLKRKITYNENRE